MASQPAAIEALVGLAAQNIQARRLPQAHALLEQVLAAQPHHPDALHLSGHVSDLLGNSEQAFARIARAIELAPDNPVYHNSLGIAYGQRLRPDEAIAAFRRALAANAHYAPALGNLATALSSSGEFDEAESSYRKLLEITPASADTCVHLGNLLQAQGRLDEAALLFERALAIEPMQAAAHAGALLNCLYQPASMPDDALQIARRFAQPYERALLPHRRPHENGPDPDRRLKVGYVSADFRRHSVAYFLEPILACHDHSQVEVFCYSIGPLRDEVTERLEGLADHWIRARGLDDAALAERIRADRIDILVDLSGHSAGNRLLVFARKPAPIQITWMGFLATTGLESMDYRLTDSVADPDGQPDAAHSERLLRLARTCLCFRPPKAAPPVGPLPALGSGLITFGSFNTPAKHNPRVVELWAGILRALPQSRLLLKGRGLDRGQLRSATLAAFEAAGISANRIVLQPYESGESEHLQCYDEIDIGLDPFPHNGVTTTCLALWMGVPVVALRGDRHSGRMCSSVLTSAGLQQCIADTFADYQAVALSLAHDLPRLAQLREELRARLRQSVLMDEVGVTREVETALRAMWQTWCGGRGKLP